MPSPYGHECRDVMTRLNTGNVPQNIIIPCQQPIAKDQMHAVFTKKCG